MPLRGRESEKTKSIHQNGLMAISLWPRSCGFARRSQYAMISLRWLWIVGASEKIPFWAARRIIWSPCLDLQVSLDLETLKDSQNAPDYGGNAEQPASRQTKLFSIVSTLNYIRFINLASSVSRREHQKKQNEQRQRRPIVKARNVLQPRNQYES